MNLMLVGLLVLRTIIVFATDVQITQNDSPVNRFSALGELPYATMMSDEATVVYSAGSNFDEGFEEPLFKVGCVLPEHSRPFLYVDASVFMLTASSASAFSPFLFGLIYDFRKRKIAESALQKSEARMRILMDSTVQAVLGVDESGRCSFCNKTALKVLGYNNEQDLLGTRVHDLIYNAKQVVLPKFADGCGVCQLCNNGKQVHFEQITLSGMSGTSIPVELWSLPVEVKNGTDGGVITFIDISERLNLHKQNIRTAQLASIGELSASVAHEINNPISGVINYSQILLNKKDLNEMQVELVRRVQNEGLRVAKIVHNLLNYSRDSHGEKRSSCIQEIVNEALSLLSPQLKKSGVTVRHEWAGSLPAVICNSQQIEQVLINILINAQQALGENKIDDRQIRISGGVVSEMEKKWLRLVLANNGPPIPRDIKERIFEPFVTTKPEGAGTGLGLSVSAKIMKKHDGEFRVRSEPGEMTEMILMFPLC